MSLDVSTLHGVPTISDDEELPGYGVARVDIETAEPLSGISFDELAAALSQPSVQSLFGDPLEVGWELRRRRRNAISTPPSP